MRLQDWINIAKNEEENGKKLSQISLEVYLSDFLNLKVLEVKELESDYEDKFEFVTTNGISEYIFHAEFYDVESFLPIQNVLILKEIRGKEGSFKLNENIWLKNDNTNNKYLKNSLSDLMKGKIEDQEFTFILDILKDSLSNIEGYLYTERRENNSNSFEIQIGKKVIIESGFGNTIQISFKNQYFNTIHFFFRDKTKTELKEEWVKYLNFIIDYCKWDINFYNHSISNLYDFLSEEKYFPSINTNILLDKGSLKFDKVLLIDSIVIGEYDSYHQVEIKIYYGRFTRSFIIEYNYLFKIFQEECINIEEIKEKIKSIQGLINK